MKELKDFSNEAAQKLDVDPVLALKVNKYYWKNGIRRNLIDLSYPSIYVKNLGTLNLSKYKVYEAIKKEIWRIRKTRASTKYKETTRVLVLERRTNRLRRLLEKRNQLIHLLNSDLEWED